MQERNEMELLIDDLVTRICEQAMAEVVEDASAQDWVAILSEIRDRCRLRIEEAAEALPEDELRALFCYLIDRAVRDKVEAVLRAAFPELSVEAPTPN